VLCQSLDTRDTGALRQLTNDGWPRQDLSNHQPECNKPRRIMHLAGANALIIAVALMPVVCAVPEEPGFVPAEVHLTGSRRPRAGGLSATTNKTALGRSRRLQSSECIVPYTESMCRTRRGHGVGTCTFLPAGLARRGSSAFCSCITRTNCEPAYNSANADGTYDIGSYIPGCPYQNDGMCDDGSRCPDNTDIADCYRAPPPPEPPPPPPPSPGSSDETSPETSPIEDFLGTYWPGLAFVGWCCCAICKNMLEEEEDTAENAQSGMLQPEPKDAAAETINPSSAGEAYEPPTVPSQEIDQPKSLAVILQEANLSQYESALRELGASFGTDLAGLEEEDLVEIGMKKLEVARFLRVAEQFK
jgi:hypothetical protein